MNISLAASDVALMPDIVQSLLLVAKTDLGTAKLVDDARVSYDHLGSALFRVDRVGGFVHPRRAMVYLDRSLAAAAKVERLEVLTFALLCAADWLAGGEGGGPGVAEAAKLLGLCPTPEQRLSERGWRSTAYRPGGDVWTDAPSLPLDVYDDRRHCTLCGYRIGSWDGKQLDGYHDNCVSYLRTKANDIATTNGHSEPTPIPTRLSKGAARRLAKFRARKARPGLE